jgi:phospho-N-acetylmuramoyl-pentapeptide-transferase
MVLIVIEYLRNLGVRVPVVFEYYSTRMLLAAMTSLMFCIFFGPHFIRKLYELKIGQPIRMEECPLLGRLHEKKKDTPTMGGVLILSSMLLSMFFWMNWKHSFTLILLVTTLWIGFMGGYDDFLKLKYKNSKGLSAKKKLFFQLVLAGGIALYLLVPPIASSVQMGGWFIPPTAREPTVKEQGVERKTAEVNLTTREYMSRLYIPFVKKPLSVSSGWFVLFIGLFVVWVMIGSSNAVNLTDGLDGLATGLLIMAAASMALIAFLSNHVNFARYLNILYIEGSGEIGIYLCALVGACLGFLWYNGYPAQVFMGDTGSLALGAVIGVSAVLLKKEFLLAIIGGLFVAEAMSVILQVGSYKCRNKKRVFLCAPLHHHFEYKGWPETKVVIRFWIIGLMLAILGIASLKFQ